MTSPEGDAPERIDGLAQLGEQVSDLALVVARQTRTIERLVDAAKTPSAAAGVDAIVLVCRATMRARSDTCSPSSASPSVRPGAEPSGDVIPPA